MPSSRTTRPSVLKLKQPLLHKVPASAGDALQTARFRLAAASKNPRRDAELLLAHALGCSQVDLFTHPERLLSPAEADRFESFVSRRLASEPLQYITGVQEFFGLPFEVSPAVLIPRPETEHLVEAALQRLDHETDLRIVDVGAGSGAIAVTLAHALPQSRVVAVDLSPAALEVTGRNAQRHGVGDRVTLVLSDLLAAVDGTGFDVVISNPPYIAEGEVLEAQVANYEPHSALYAGPTGMEIYERLIPQAAQVLKPQGWLMMEIGYGQRSAVENLVRDWTHVAFLDDLQGIPRVVVAQRSR
jgi:release factor glutamine methyltransferase